MCISDDDSGFEWAAYLKQTRSEAAPESLFRPVPSAGFMAQFKVRPQHIAILFSSSTFARLPCM